MCVCVYITIARAMYIYRGRERNNDTICSLFPFKKSNFCVSNPKFLNPDFFEEERRREREKREKNSNKTARA